MIADKSPISTSIVTYETEPSLLEAALASISNSTVLTRNYVIDNSSGDYLRHVAKKFGAIYIHSGKNIGFGCGHNLALSMIGRSSKYHVILNPDVSFGPSVLHELHAFLEANSEIGWVMPKILYPDGSQQNLCKRLPTPWNLFRRRFLGNRRFSSSAVKQDRFECDDLDLTKPRPIPYLSGCFALVRTDMMQAVGGFDERFFLYLEDTDLVRRIGEIALTVFYPYVSVNHVHGRGSYRNRKLLGHHMLSTVKYFCKWGWFIDPNRSRINRLIASDERDITVPNEIGEWALNEVQ